MGKQNKRPKVKGKQRVKNATKLIKDGILFKSKLELFTYIKLKEYKLKFEYEEHRFTILEAGEYPGLSMELSGRGTKRDYQNTPKYSSITYTPDFVNLNEGWIIECKGYPNERFPLVWKMFKVLMTNTKVEGTTKHFDLYVPRNQAQVLKTIELIKQSKNEKS